MKKEYNTNQKLILISIPFIIILGIIALIASRQLVDSIRVKKDIYYCTKGYTLNNNLCIKKIKIDANKIGDINKDNSIDIIDYNILTKYINNEINLDSYQQLLSDVNKDNSIDIIDLNIINNYINNIGTIKSNIGNNICQDDYKLSNNYCTKKESIKAKKK